jgi:hypothetical protein
LKTVSKEVRVSPGIIARFASSDGWGQLYNIIYDRDHLMAQQVMAGINSSASSVMLMELLDFYDNVIMASLLSRDGM